MEDGKYFYAKRPEDNAVVPITCTQSRFDSYYVNELHYVEVKRNGEPMKVAESAEVTKDADVAGGTSRTAKRGG